MQDTEERGKETSVEYNFWGKRQLQPPQIPEIYKRVEGAIKSPEVIRSGLHPGGSTSSLLCNIEQDWGVELRVWWGQMEW